MFEHAMADEANAKGHQTVVQAAEQAREARARRTVLFHFSPRYKNEELGALEAEARAVTPDIEAGRDLARYVLPVPE
jgi:ribonuclease Z